MCDVSELKVMEHRDKLIFVTHTREQALEGPQLPRGFVGSDESRIEKPKTIVMQQPCHTGTAVSISASKISVVTRAESKDQSELY